MSEEVYKNIQVLKGVPSDQLYPTMQYFQTSLGVGDAGCAFCHQMERGTNIYELDGNSMKQVTRRMIQMVYAINKDAFDGRREVTCYSCHRGSTVPVGMPLVGGQEPRSAPAETREAGETNPGAMPTVDQLLDKYVAALGGADAIQKLSSRVEKGTVTDLDGRPSPVEIFSKGPDKYIDVRHLENGDTLHSYNGGVAWVRFGGANAPRDMRSEELDAARLEDPFYFAGRMKQVFSELRIERTEKVGDRETYVVSGRAQGLPLVKLYFDKDSGILVRLVYYMETAIGRFPTQTDYAEYRDVDGLKIPIRWTIAGIRGRYLRYQIDEVQRNIPIEESKFAKPGRSTE
jgi:hypothetical protein